MKDMLVLGQRAVREAIRAPEALFPTIFIPVFFLVVNVGQAARIFPSGDTAFLHGQNYAAFQLPVTLLMAASFGMASMALVEEIEGGYFDKLRATPVSRTALVLGRLYAEFIKTAVLSALLVVVALPFGIRIDSGVLGLLVLVTMISLWAVVFNGFVQLIALGSRNAAATQSGGMIFFPLLFLTPNFVPRDLLTRPMEVAATYNPVTYIMEGARSLVIEGFDATALLRAFAVIAAAGIVMVALNVRMVNRYD